MKKPPIFAAMALVSIACWSQGSPATTYDSLYTGRLGKTADTNQAGGYLFEEIFDQPRTSGQPYYPILKVTKGGQTIRIITPDDVPLQNSDCAGGTCEQIRSTDPTFEFSWGPCFGKAIFDGPGFLAYSPEGNVFYFCVSTQSPALWADRTFVFYYADLDSNDLFRIGKTWGSILKDGNVSPGEGDYISYRVQYDKMGETVGWPLRVMRIYDGKEKTFPDDLNLPKDQFPYYSVHSFTWIDQDRIQLEIYAYKDFPGDEETSKGATIQTVIYDMKASTRTVAAPRKNTALPKSPKREVSANVPAKRKPKKRSPRPKSDASAGD